MSNQYFTLPRLFVDAPLSEGAVFLLDRAQAHYLKTVMRKQVNDYIRLFNAREGEWLASISEISKKDVQVRLVEQIAPQPDVSRRVHLFFAPLKKARMDILVEKVVELGVTDLHPIVTNRTDVRKINAERIQAQILEAAEQCERFSIPVLHDLRSLPEALGGISGDVRVFSCLERGADDAIEKQNLSGDVGFIVGPAGGFDADEVALLEGNSKLHPVSLGKTIYRAETAAIICLVRAQ